MVDTERKQTNKQAATASILKGRQTFPSFLLFLTDAATMVIDATDAVCSLWKSLVTTL